MAAPRVLLVGTGRTAFHLGHALVRGKARLTGVMGRDPERTAALAHELACAPLAPGPPLPACDLVLLAVSDDAIGAVAKRLPRTAAVIAHTSGAQSMAVLGKPAHGGVLWPIQSLSPGAPADLAHVPLVIDSSDADARKVMLAVAHRISDRVLELPHKQREALHMAAVLASNFPVFLFARAQRILQERNLPPDLLTPLWRSVAQKAADAGPDATLTGPARRGDRKTLGKHLDLLKGDRELRRAYALLTRMILAANGHATDGLEDL